MKRCILLIVVVLISSVQAQQQGPIDSTGPKVVYHTDFAATVDSAWSNKSKSTTPNGRVFLGKFANDTVTLSLDKLPPHQLVRLTFELFIIDTWDGSGRITANADRAGPDYWELDVAGGPTLVRSTFSALPLDEDGFDETGKLQTFPWPIPSRPVKMGTAATGVTQLGYVYTFKKYNVSFPMDVNYLMGYTFPHSGDSIALNFSGAGLGGVNDESWGITNVQVEVLNQKDVPPITPELMPQMWERIVGTKNPVGSHKSFWRFVANPDAAVKFLEANAPGFGLDVPAAQKQLAALSRDLDDPEALAALAELGPPVEPVLREAAGNDPSLTPAMLKVLREIEVTPIESPLGRRAAAAARLLSTIDTPAARQLLAKLITQPRPQPATGTAAYDDEWLARFQDTYRLDSGQVIKYLPPQKGGDRDRFVKEYRQRRAVLTRSTFGLDKDPEGRSGFAAWTGGRVSFESNLYFPDPRIPVDNEPLPEKGIRRYLHMLGLQGRPTTDKPPQFVITHRPLDHIDLPGDWLIRTGAKQEQALPALLEIIRQQTGRNLVLGKEKLDQEVIVVSGQYAWKQDQPDDEDGVIQIYAAHRNQKAIPKVQNITLDKLLETLSFRAGLRFINETGENSPVKVAYHSNSQDNYQTDVGLEGLLINLSKQTSLKFQKEKRAFEYPAIHEQPATTQPVEK